MSNVTLNVNGATHAVDIDPATPLLYVLRNDLGLRGPRFGCGLGQCGACTVIIDGQATRSCVMLTSREKWSPSFGQLSGQIKVKSGFIDQAASGCDEVGQSPTSRLDAKGAVQVATPQEPEYRWTAHHSPVRPPGPASAATRGGDSDAQRV